MERPGNAEMRPSVIGATSRLTCGLAHGPLSIAAIEKIASADRAASAGVAATRAIAAKLCAFSGDRFQTATACPALARLAAIPLPILPRPKNATFAICCSRFQFVRAELALRGAYRFHVECDLRPQVARRGYWGRAEWESSGFEDCVTRAPSPGHH